MRLMTQYLPTSRSLKTSTPSGSPCSGSRETSYAKTSRVNSKNKRNNRPRRCLTGSLSQPMVEPWDGKASVTTWMQKSATSKSASEGAISPLVTPTPTTPPAVSSNHSGVFWSDARTSEQNSSNSSLPSPRLPASNAAIKGGLNQFVIDKPSVVPAIVRVGPPQPQHFDSGWAVVPIAFESVLLLVVLECAPCRVFPLDPAVGRPPEDNTGRSRRT